MEDYTQTATSLVMSYLPPFVAAIVILVIGRWVARLLTNVLRRALSRARVEETLIKFAGNLTYAALLAFVVLAALNQLGVQTTSFIAVIGAAGLAIGLAMQGSLSNFAAGVMLIVFRPFKAGDYIEAAGTAGTVEEIMVFSTKLKTPDNKVVVVPNNAIISGNITNYSAKDTRRVDLVFGCGYGDDVQKAKAVLTAIVEGDPRILKDPAPTIGILELGESSINFAVRPWVKSSDYWGVFFDLQEAVKLRFDAEGLSIPFPQTDVHIHQSKAA